MATSSYRVRTSTIGVELARLIRVGSGLSSLKVCQYGAVDRIAAAKKLTDLVPAVIVEPFPRTTYEPLDMSGSESTVRESFRIAYFYEYAPTDDPATLAATNVGLLLAALRSDATLSGIASTIARDQVTWSGLAGIDWSPEEQVFLLDAGLPLQVVVLEWYVTWLNRA